MKRIKIKRLVYHHLATNEEHYGGYEFDGNLTDENILGALFDFGKHEWIPNFGHTVMYQYNNQGELVYRISVETFYRYEKSWYNLLADNIKRILRI